MLLWREEFSFRLFAACAAATLALGWICRISTVEWLFVATTIGMVLAVEAINTAIEELCDHVTPEEHPKIGKVKDLSSGASLIVLCAAFVVGVLIFTPKVLSFI